VTVDYTPPSSFFGTTSLATAKSPLKSLWLNSNGITGSIPESIFHLSGLNQFHIAGNQISGTIPTTIGILSNLDYSLDFKNNRLTGTIPLELSHLTKIEWIDLSQNQLMGEIPAELGGDVHEPTLKTLILRWNRLEGSVPHFIQHLEYVAIQGNANLTGSLCPAMGHIEADCGGSDARNLDCPCCSLCCDADGNCYKPQTSTTGGATATIVDTPTP